MANHMYFSNFLETFDEITHLCGLQTCVDHLICVLQYTGHWENNDEEVRLLKEFLDFVSAEPM